MKIVPISFDNSEQNPVIYCKVMNGEEIVCRFNIFLSLDLEPLFRADFELTSEQLDKLHQKTVTCFFKGYLYPLKDKTIRHYLFGVKEISNLKVELMEMKGI